MVFTGLLRGRGDAQSPKTTSRRPGWVASGVGMQKRGRFYLLHRSESNVAPAGRDEFRIVSYPG